MELLLSHEVRKVLEVAKDTGVCRAFLYGLIQYKYKNI